ncbi:MAG: hypothetical protein A2751_02005 [Candidatus Doudnabacteria bacterium RIFCSPHIGHO2_01_FULL_46_14]|uniref:SHOCT domain-containing protein n=1 Tax=Candidatus Doudnabacteria bacterium RIFCSPHIGHO2_01_FULL_46_14 TaxID=1817824 RepID=A0A1F5NJC7_9BACT|nr:MAG: hypothetical protein A2751_02005 [Candidatus Doudnabacteria bacterium RIFCSPHIGHO2_01_FULL_46_14]
MMGFGYYQPFGALGMILSWVVIIAVIALIVRWVARANGKLPGTNTALDILKERYAKGEIGKHEFEEKKKDLEK